MIHSRNRRRSDLWPHSPQSTRSFSMTRHAASTGRPHAMQKNGCTSGWAPQIAQRQSGCEKGKSRCAWSAEAATAWSTSRRCRPCASMLRRSMRAPIVVIARVSGWTMTVRSVSSSSADVGARYGFSVMTMSTSKRLEQGAQPPAGDDSEAHVNDVDGAEQEDGGEKDRQQERLAGGDAATGHAQREASRVAQTGE